MASPHPLNPGEKAEEFAATNLAWGHGSSWVHFCPLMREIWLQFTQQTFLKPMSEIHPDLLGWQSSGFCGKDSPDLGPKAHWIAEAKTA